MQGEAHFQRQNIMPLIASDATKPLPPAADKTVERLTRIWQELLNVERVDPHQNYFDLGGDSSLAVQLFSAITSEFHVQLPLATLFDAPTVAELADVLRNNLHDPVWSPLVEIQPLGSRPPFFCMHGAGGNVLIYRELSQRLGTDQPFYGLQSQGLDGVAAPLRTIEEMAALYVNEIRKVSPHGPYLLGGYCMGGTIAFEVAQQLKAVGEEVSLLALFDTMNWSNVAHPSAMDRTYHGIQRLQFHVANFLCLDSVGMFKFFREKLDDLRERLPVWMGMSLGRFDPKRFRMPMPESRALGKLWQVNDRACLAYIPKPYPGVITDFRPRKQYSHFSKAEAKWESIAQRGQKIVILPVYPAGMLVEPFVKHLAESLRDCINDAIHFDE
jgi:phthiocerol/phenolphthiocerol synthesis type-I polyketide synthase E